MNRLVLLSLALGLSSFATVPAQAQAQRAPFDFAAMVRCSVERHPDLTRRYAVYHLQRRDNQTVEQNVADPDSSLLFPALEGCHDPVTQGLPFTPDDLVLAWGRAHGLPGPVLVRDTDTLASCAMSYARDQVRNYLAAQPGSGKLVAMSDLYVLMCQPTSGAHIDIPKLDDLLARGVAARAADAGEVVE